MTTTTAKKATQATAPRRRTRKSTTAKATPAKTKAVAKYSKVSPKPVVKVTEPTPAPTVAPRPEVTVSLDSYKKDIQARWAIHQWEIDALIKDIKAGYQFVKPYAVKSVDYVKASYDRAFNTTASS